MVPCRPATFDLAAISATLDLCKLANKEAIVVINAAPIRSRVVQEAEEAVREKGGIVSPVVIRQRVSFQHCLIDGRTAGEFEPGAQRQTRLPICWQTCKQGNSAMTLRPPLTHRPQPVAPEPTRVEPTPQVTAPEPVAPAPVPQQRRGGGYRSPSRVGKRAAVAWLEPEAVKQLNMVAIQRDMQVQQILVEAINDWFARNGLPRFDAS